MFKTYVQGVLHCFTLQAQMSDLVSCHWPRHITCVLMHRKQPSVAQQNFYDGMKQSSIAPAMWNAELYLPAIPHDWCRLLSILSHSFTPWYWSNLVLQRHIHTNVSVHFS